MKFYPTVKIDLLGLLQYTYIDIIEILILYK